MYKKIKKLTILEILSLIFYPIHLFYQVPVAWFKSIYNSRVLFSGNLKNYLGYELGTSLNNMYYRNIWLNLKQYGRYKTSPFVGLGEYPLRNWFHISYPSIFLFSNAGALVTLLSTIIWVLSHLIWVKTSSSFWVFLVVTVLFFSSSSYAMAFVRQNYQMLGWMFFPIALFFSSEGNFIMSSIAWYLTGLGGITQIFFGLPVIFYFALINKDTLILLSLIPVLLQLGLRFLPFLQNGGFKGSISEILKIVGFSKNKVLYDRSIKHYSVLNWYFTGLYFFSLILLGISNQGMSTLIILGITIFIINQRFYRVADLQSVIVMISTLFTFEVINSDPSILAILSLWLGVNPLGYFLKINQRNEINSKTSPFTPFDHSVLESKVEKFLELVPRNKKIYCAFDDPKGIYSNVFDGLRILHELPIQICLKKGVHLFPDWWAVSSTNYVGSPNFWGRSLDAVLENCEKWHSEFVIIYQDSKTTLDKSWLNNFEKLSELDWSCYQDLLHNSYLWTNGVITPKWFLLRKL